MTAVESSTTAATVTPDPIFQIASGFMAAKLLFVANEVQLFEQLGSGPAALNDLPERMGIAPRRLRVLLDAMVALNLVQRLGELYQNGPVAAAFLSGRTPVDLRPFLRFWNHLSYPTWMRLEDAIRTGQGQATMRLADHEQRIFSEGVEAIQAAPSHALPAAYDFAQHRKLLDLGGGTGSWLRAILHQYRHLKGVAIRGDDCPPVSGRRPGDTRRRDCRRRLLPGPHPAQL
jgi:hypothetical protein